MVTAQTGHMAGAYTIDFTSETAFTVIYAMGNVVGAGLADAAFSTQDRFTITAGATAFFAGDGFTITVSGVVQANVICAALPSVYSALLAYAIVVGPGAGLVAAVNWFQTLTTGRLIAIDAWRKVLDWRTTLLVEGVAATLELTTRVVSAWRLFLLVDL